VRYGIGHHNVESAELVQARLQRDGQRCAVADVALSRHDARPGVLDELDGGGQILRGGQRIRHAGDLNARVDGDDVRAIGRQSYSVRAALTARGAGDDRDFSF